MSAPDTIDLWLLDADPDNADWTKQTLDLPDITTADELRTWLADHNLTVADFKALPAYRLALEDSPWLATL